MGTPLVDLTGQRFGLLTAVVRVRFSLRKRYVAWECRCDCGEVVVVSGDRLRQGRKVQCHRRNHPPPRTGAAVVHRLTYQSWLSAWKRVRARSGKHWRNYGARGITVCDRWRKFENFLADMGERTDATLTIDRINNDGNYEPGNCRWATDEEQRLNRRNSAWVEYGGERLRLKDLCDAKGLGYSMLAGRLKAGWDIERALSEPVRAKRQNAAVAKSDI